TDDVGLPARRIAQDVLAARDDFATSLRVVDAAVADDDLRIAVDGGATLWRRQQVENVALRVEECGVGLIACFAIPRLVEETLRDRVGRRPLDEQRVA